MIGRHRAQTARIADGSPRCASRNQPAEVFRRLLRGCRECREVAQRFAAALGSGSMPQLKSLLCVSRIVRVRRAARVTSSVCTETRQP